MALCVRAFAVPSAPVRHAAAPTLGTLQQVEEHRTGCRDDVAVAPPGQDDRLRLLLGWHLWQHGLGPLLAVSVAAAHVDDLRAGGVRVATIYGDADRNGLAEIRGYGRASSIALLVELVGSVQRWCGVGPFSAPISAARSGDQ